MSQDFKPAITLDETTQMRLAARADAFLGKRDLSKFMSEVGRELKRLAPKRKIDVVDFTTDADRAHPRIQIGVKVDGVPDHGLIFGFRGNSAGASADN